jgi:hypothetical protein
MEPVTDQKCSLLTGFATLSPTALIWQDVLAQAMTGELIAAMNYIGRHRELPEISRDFHLNSIGLQLSGEPA